MRNIQVLKPKYRVEECLSAIRECLECGWTGPGFKTVEFEEAWKTYTGLSYAHFLNSGTAGLHLAIHILKAAYGWSNGDEIITTPLTFVSTNHAILYENLFPAFADVDPNTLCLNPESVEKTITPRTRAVMYVGIGGNVGHLAEIRDICKKHGLKLILDAAHMAGTKVGVGPTIDQNYQHVGQEADVTVFSFQAVKNLPTADSGMVCFRDPEFDARARKLSWLGIDKDTFLRSHQGGSYKWKYDVPDLGFKYHGNSIMAALGLVGLKYLDEDNARRRALFEVYRVELKDVEGMQIANSDTCHMYSRHLAQVIIPDKRDYVLNELNEDGVYPGVHYIDNTHYRIYRHSTGTCPHAHRLSNELLTLPLHLDMTDDDAVRVSTLIQEALNGS